jgi:mannose-6-phosphate isomerase-like protein (cupin superfamily)
MLFREGSMLGRGFTRFRTGAFGLLVYAVLAFGQQTQKKVLVIPLVCEGNGCPLLQGAPQTAGVRSGFVRLMQGRIVGRHTTGKNEETLVILHGLDGSKKVSFTAPAAVYIPPQTHHDVLNTGKEPLEYVYVVAPVTTQ